ncbi:hypothetical protein BJY04DRAFT_134667 [Aspergillus karnatakaensis]|uniref:RidA family protein n=1 Tax=Aspergillus karnatakaensis TaxID=1810916 RepID=UPI003CCE1F1F
MLLSSTPLTQTANRQDTPPPGPLTSALSITPFPPGAPTLALLRTSAQVAHKPPSKHPTPYERWKEDQTRWTFKEQAHRAFENLRAVLALSDATPRDITKLTIYYDQDGSGAGRKLEVAQRQLAELDEVMRGFLTYLHEGGEGVHRPPCSIVNAKVVTHELGEYLIGVEAEAVVRWRAPPEYVP